MLALDGRARTLRGEMEGSRWEMALRLPAPGLRPYVVGEYVGYSERTRGLTRRREFPGAAVVMALEFGPPLRVLQGGDERRCSASRGGFVAGIGDEAAVCEHDGFQHGIQVNLTPIGARLVLGIPMSEIGGGVVAVRDVLPRRHRGLDDRLRGLRGWDARFDVLDAVLAERVGAAPVDTRVVSWGVRRIEETGGSIEMGALARELGYSRKHVIALFRDQVGIPPKLFARIVRFERLARHLRAAGGGTWADLALEFGYYDQAHLVREVQRFTGLTPTQMRPSLTNAFARLT